MKLFWIVQLLNQLPSEDLVSWNKKFNFVSLAQLFNNIVNLEWAISDYYENLIRDELNTVEIPLDPVHSQEYLDGLDEGFIRIVGEKGDEYFDYNIYETHMSPVLNKEGMVKIGDQIYQFTIDGKKILAIGNYNIELLKKAKKSNPTEGISIFSYIKQSSSESIRANSYSTSWRYYSRPGNGWTVDGNRRFRAWVEGSSSVVNESYNYGQELYVTNVLRIEGQKKNFWGKWGYRETYYATANLSWEWYYTIDRVDRRNNLNSPGYTSPINWSANYVNNATVPLAPHTSGYYEFPHVFDCGDVGLCGQIGPVEIFNFSGTASIDGKSWSLNYTY